MIHARVAPAVCGVVLLASLLTGCDDGSDGDEPAAAPEVVASGSLVVCTEPPYEPFVADDDGEPGGFELDLLERMAAGLDLDLEVRRTPYADLDDGQALADDLCDVAAGALAVTADREKRMAFTTPHYDVRVTLLVPAASDIDSLEDLSGRRLAVQQDTAAEQLARTVAPQGTDLVVLTGGQYMLDALRQGRVDGVLQDLTLNLPHARTGRFDVVDERATGEEYAFAVRRDAPRLRRDLDSRLAELRRDGTYDALYDEYFTVG